MRPGPLWCHLRGRWRVTARGGPIQTNFADASAAERNLGVSVHQASRRTARRAARSRRRVARGAEAGRAARRQAFGVILASYVEFNDDDFKFDTAAFSNTAGSQAVQDQIERGPPSPARSPARPHRAAAPPRRRVG
jgi:hypothetical protein